jgi:hypothetical protein
VAVRTVANWRDDPGIIPQQRNQEILDTALDRASDRAKAKFAALVGEADRAILAVGHVENFEISLSATASPEFADSEYLQSIRRHILEIVELDNRFGGADLVRLSTRFFRALRDQLGAAPPLSWPGRSPAACSWPSSASGEVTKASG